MIKDSFEARDLYFLRWIQDKFNVADAMTKKNPHMYWLLNPVTTTGVLEVPNHRLFVLTSTD